MVATVPLPSVRLRRFSKTVTLSNAAGSGAIGTVAIATVTDAVLITHIVARVTTTLAGSSATVELGTAANTAALIAQATATTLAAGDFWIGSTTPAGVASAVVDKAVKGDIVLTVATANVTAGEIVFDIFFLPLSTNGNLA